MTPDYSTHADYMAEQDIEAQEWREAERVIRSHRGRWMVIDEHGFVVRFRRKSEADGYCRWNRHVGVRAVVRRWRGDMVLFSWTLSSIGYVYAGKWPRALYDRHRFSLAI